MHRRVQKKEILIEILQKYNCMTVAEIGKSGHLNGIFYLSDLSSVS